MFKNIAFFFVLILSGIAACVAEKSGNTALNSIVTEDFDARLITDLAYPVCTWNLEDNKKENFYHFVEGEICPASGEPCTYSGIMKLDGKIAVLKQISSDSGISVFKNNNATITTKLAPINNPKIDLGNEEESYFSAVVVVQTKHGEKKLEMTGFCSI